MNGETSVFFMATTVSECGPGICLGAHPGPTIYSFFTLRRLFIFLKPEFPICQCGCQIHRIISFRLY